MSMRKILLTFGPFWVFLLIYKFGAGLHLSLLSPLGERILPIWAVGLLIGLGSFVQLLLDVPAGHLLDRFGYRRLLKITTFTFFFAGIALMFQFNLAAYLITLALATFGWLFFGPGINAYILSHAPEKNSAKFISFRDVFGSIGIVLSSASLGIVLTFETMTMGLIISLLMLMALAALFLSPSDVKKVDHREHHYHICRHYLHEVITILGKLNPASTTLLLLNLASSIFYGVIWFIVPLVIAHQANSGLLSLGLGIFDFAVVVLGFILGNMADKGNKRTLVFFGLLLFSISGMLLGFNFGWLFLIFGFLATTGDEMAAISLWSWLHSLDRDHANDGLVSGVLNLFGDLGWAIGPILAGFLYGLVGPSWTIASAATLIFLIWVLYQFFLQSHKPVPGTITPHKPKRKMHHI